MDEVHDTYRHVIGEEKQERSLKTGDQNMTGLIF